MLGLADQIGRHESRHRGTIRDQHHLAWACDAIDVDGSEHMLLGERDKQVARPDDLVDRLQTDRLQSKGNAATPWRRQFGKLR